MNTPTSLAALFETEAGGMAERFGIAIPPPVFEDMAGRLVDYVPRRSLTIAFPVYPRYAGPTGKMQGGLVTAAFDNTFGPFSYLLAKRPCVTVNIDTTFIRPIPATSEETLTVTATVRARTRTMLFMEGVAYFGKDRLAATAGTSMVILRDTPTEEANEDE